MQLPELREAVQKGEDSQNQFKQDITNPDGLASEIVAFLNAGGGTIYIGVSDVGKIGGLDALGVRRVNQLISNVATQSIKNPVSLVTENISVGKGRVVIAVHVAEGADKPYFDKNGVVWLKEGADKRRVVSKEEIRRFFASSLLLHGDEQLTKATIDLVDAQRLSRFLRETYGIPFPRSIADRLRLMKNLNLANDDNRLNLAGLLLFGKHPESLYPQFGIKAVRMDGVSLAAMSYSDSEDYAGCLADLYNGARGFIMRNLHKRQTSGGVNMPGVSEISPEVIEELLVNALLHRDYFVSAPTRVIVFDDRVEIVSPGSLPDHLTVEKILSGNTSIRNPILASFIAKGILPYHGLGSGIMRAKAICPRVKFVDDRDGLKFTAIIPRDSQDGEHENLCSQYGKAKIVAKGEMSDESSLKSSLKIIEAIKANPYCTYDSLAGIIGVSRRAITKQMKKLRQEGRLRRIGPDKGGHWEAVFDEIE